MRKVHNEYCDECERNPVKYYEGYRPAFNVAIVQTGDWLGKVPSTATATISYATLPNTTNEEQKKRIEAAFAADPDLRDSTTIEYVFDRGCSVLDFDHPLVKEVQQCAQAHGYPGEVVSQKALCDMYFYLTTHGIPSVSIGPGGPCGHSASEHIEMASVMRIAEVLLDWLDMRAKQA